MHQRPFKEKQHCEIQNHGYEELSSFNRGWSLGYTQERRAAGIDLVERPSPKNLNEASGRRTDAKT